MTVPRTSAETLQHRLQASAWSCRHDRCWVRSTLDLHGRLCEVARIDWWPHLRDGHEDSPYRLSMLHNQPPLGNEQRLPPLWFASLTEAMAAADSLLTFHGWELLPYRW